MLYSNDAIYSLVLNIVSFYAKQHICIALLGILNRIPHEISPRYMQLMYVSCSDTISGLILGFQPSQCETALQSNAVAHWLGANLESALNMIDILWLTYLKCKCNKTFQTSKYNHQTREVVDMALRCTDLWFCSIGSKRLHCHHEVCVIWCQMQ